MFFTELIISFISSTVIPYVGPFTMKDSLRPLPLILRAILIVDFASTLRDKFFMMNRPYVLSSIGIGYFCFTHWELFERNDCFFISVFLFFDD